MVTGEKLRKARQVRVPKVRGSSAGLTRLNYLAANGPLTNIIHWAQKLNKPRGADSAGKRSTDPTVDQTCGPSTEPEQSN